mmetsp:Transcript_50955/g.65258  ORF Transcript_50955/g.65258 Transcript_50955/m.65258 type:complete len:234 (+) Transcript_50955:98-799(+)
MDRLIQVAIADDRQNRPENLILHDLHIRRGLQRQRNRHLAGAILQVLIGRIDLNQLGPFFPRIVKIALQAVILALIDNRRVILVIPQARIHRRKLMAILIHKRLHTVCRAQHIIRCHTGLARIQRLAESDTLGGVFHRNIRRYDGRRLAAQFQSHRREIFRGCPHHQLAHRRGAGEQKVIEGPAGKVCGDIRFTVNHTDQVLRKRRFDNLLEQSRGVRRELRHLDHRTVTRSQ